MARSNHELIHEVARQQATKPRGIDDIKYVLDWLVESVSTLQEASISAMSRQH